ncbi:hypothetical protein SteCoe_35376 [Stentor coeruleus]|uniref:Cyclic nucleotide-binding domain-containing protein n=1 Tax=Stentor coeruleus TaxID=5963 RepID=A0A1R2ASF4_9CILI|nr:hypothetical protein SteCoe_35376 [Stentor coeruleus]
MIRASTSIPKTPAISLDNAQGTLFEDNNLIRKNSEKYKEIWQRSYRKIKTNLRLMKMFSRVATGNDIGDEFDITKRFNSIGDSLFLSKSEENFDKPSNFIIDPHGKLYLFWLSLMSVLLLYIAIVDPFMSAFIDLDDDKSQSVDIIVDLMFMLDFLVNLNLAFDSEDGVVVRDRKEIFFRYLKGWMIMDACSSVPLGIINAAHGSKSSANGLIKLVRLRNLPKLLKLGKLLKMLNHFLMLEDIDYMLNKHHKLFRFLKVVLSVFLCIHIVACLFYTMAKLEDFGPTTWVARYKIQDQSIGEQYQTCLYWTITTLATIGYGDIVPLTYSEKLLAMIWMIIGVYVISYSVGSLTSFYSELELKESIMHSRILMAEDFASKVGISKQILYKLKRTIRVLPINTGKREIEKFLQSIPVRLRYEIALDMYEKSILKFPFFCSKSRAFVADIALRLDLVIFESGNTMWYENEAAEGIYFIIEGKIKYKCKGIIFSIMHDGQYFGDIEIIYETERKYQAECSEFTKLLKMKMQVIDMIKNQYPYVWEEMKSTCKIRAKKLTENLAEMMIVKKINDSGELKNITLHDYKHEAEETFEILKI